ncbi:hypothetical protein UNPF46_30845 [Bradyrhizobium sp. UNPF46]|uniref:hypothetical protein n=1 Tax=Bradyrhizobium sp. UNPF46 TaxID=1141168 RepID=UPI00114FDB2F|nr:hypothetical protein [Bradyrhizobium sp. UNPF46]TQF27459.1 hypothetical protein UNPF46_30845 [Bradyrhizobium sp. UNPF46]
MMKWIALLSIFLCSSAFAQTPSPDPIAVIRAQIMQHWFPAPQVNLNFAVSFDLDRDGRIIAQPVVAATSYDQGGSAESLKYAVLGAQPFLLLRPEDYESWKHVTTTFTRADKNSTDIYAFTKRDILGVATGMTAEAAKAAMAEKGCSVSSPKPTILECTNKGNKLVARVTEHMSPNVVTVISYIFQSGAPAQELVGLISAQFYTRPFNRIWHLSNSSTMELNQYSSEPRSANSPVPSWVLTINEPRFLDQDQDALADKQRAAAPPPKF